MTQIVGAITKKHVLLASDRKLTWISGPDAGKTKDDDTCKLVSLCNVGAFGYTGLAEIDGKTPTYEWIVACLQEGNCRDSRRAAEILAREAEKAFVGVSIPIEQSFLYAGWVFSPDRQTLVPHFQLVTNVIDSNQKRLKVPGKTFQVFTGFMKPYEDLVLFVVGQPLRPDRKKIMRKCIRRLAKNEIGPGRAM